MEKAQPTERKPFFIRPTRSICLCKILRQQTTQPTLLWAQKDRDMTAGWRPAAWPVGVVSIMGVVLSTAPCSSSRTAYVLVCSLAAG